MSERQEQTNTQAQEVLQHSELTARLLRRLTVSPGIIDVRTLRQIAVRLAGGITRTLSLLDDLMARYGIDDHLMIENPPLVMEQPWMVNINAYLTNYNSFSSTTNQFIASAAAPQSHSSTVLLSNTLSPELSSSPPSQSSTDSIISSGGAPGHEANSRVESRDTNRRVQSHEAKSVLDETASLPLLAGKFRVSRSPAQRVWKKLAADVQDVARIPVVKPSEDSTASASTAPASTASTSTVPTAARIEAGKIGEGQIESAKAIASTGTPPTKLPLARMRIAQSQIQRKSLDENVNISQPPAKIREVRDTPRPAEAKRPHAPSAPSVELELVEPNRETKTADSSPPAPGRKGVPRQTSQAEVTTQTSQTAVPTRTSMPPLPLVQKLNASPSVQKRPPDFIWRKGADVPMLKDFTSAISNAGSLQSLNRTTGGASSVQPYLSVQQQQNSQTFTPETAQRKDETQAGSGISTERVLRNIARKLLIERERRGY